MLSYIEPKNIIIRLKILIYPKHRKPIRLCYLNYIQNLLKIDIIILLFPYYIGYKKSEKIISNIMIWK